MKRFIMTMLLLLTLLVGLFAQAEIYTEKDLLNYLQDVPGSHLPSEDQLVKIRSGFFSVEDVNIDGPGVDYLVKFIGSKYQSMSFSQLIYIYSENIKTRKIPGAYSNPTVITIDTEIVIRYTGYTAPAIRSDGNRIDIPIFITE